VTARANRRAAGRPFRGEREEGSSRSELLDAAHAVFAEHGYAAASVEEVIRRAGLSKGTFYFNFRGKDDLFFAVLDEYLDRPGRALMELTASAPGDEPTSGAVSAALAAILRQQRSTLLLLQEYWSQAARDERLATRYRERQANLRVVLAHALRERHEHTGVPLLFDVDRLAEAFIALAHGLALEAVVDPDAVDDDLYGDLLALVYDGLRLRATDSSAH
jgi:AcrR family transcriptional regulator